MAARRYQFHRKPKMKSSNLKDHSQRMAMRNTKKTNPNVPYSERREAEKRKTDEVCMKSDKKMRPR